MEDPISHEPIDVSGIADRLNRATTGPWYRDSYDYDGGTSMVVVSTQKPNPSRRFSPRWGEFETEAIVAATLVQYGPAFCHASERWDQDAEFIAYARTDVKVLVAEVIRLTAVIDGGNEPADPLWHEPIDLVGIAELLARATPGPWYPDVFNDAAGDSLVVVATERPNPDHRGIWPDIPHDKIVAATLVQSGPEFCHGSGRHDQDAEFIAHARTDTEVLLAEVIRLRAIVDASSGPLPGNGSDRYSPE